MKEVIAVDMTAEQAMSVLENVAINLTGALAGMAESDSAATLLERQISAIDFAKAALDKQIPKKPIKDKVTEYAWYWKCPVCANRLIQESFCGSCGQTLDWTEDEG